MIMCSICKHLLIHVLCMYMLGYYLDYFQVEGKQLRVV